MNAWIAPVQFFFGCGQIFDQIGLCSANIDIPARDVIYGMKFIRDLIRHSQ